MEWGGRTLTVETGKFALQAQGACTVRYGDTVIMATVVKSESVRGGIDYFPLMVDFEEKLYAAGKIKGSRFIKREGRPSDEAILAGRLIDRAIRPLFDERIRNDVQVIVTALAVDGENDAAITGLIAASCALSLSPIPWNGPIAAARIGRIDGQSMLNLRATEDEKSDLNMVVAGTPEKLVMVEAAVNQVADSDVEQLLEWGAGELAPVVAFIKKIQAEAGAEKFALPSQEERDATDEGKVENATKAFVASIADSMIFNEKKVSKKERNVMLAAVKEKAKEHLVSLGLPEEAFDAGLKNIKLYVEHEITKRILDKKQRLDGRGVEEIRELHTEIDLLPRVHGSGFFMRGDTHVLSVVTLGAPGDVQTLDSMEEDGTKRYMHHYNDAPYSYGEAGPLRGPGRRAIGHGALAERALMPVLPAEADFPYTIRVVSEVMSSNGSSSMASTCGSTLSLMAAGVPITKPVAGIAMGLASDMNGRTQVLTDLQDVEDGPGGMDFKIAGTDAGITAIQMDTKTHGLSWETVRQTFKQAKEARLKILESMKQTIATPRADLSPFAPRIETIMINPEKIRDVIGPGGKVINKIIADTGVQIDIEQDGRVMVTSNDAEGMKKAIQMVKDLTLEPEAGQVYEGKVVRLEDFGAFVQITPNKDGLVHVSEIAWTRIGKPGDVLNIGDVVKVKVKEIDNLGRVNLSMKALLPKPEGFVEAPPMSRPMGDRKPGGFRGGPRRPFNGPRSN